MQQDDSIGGDHAKDAAFVKGAREKLGELWGLGRSLTRAELARALKLSLKHGGSHISKLEAGGPNGPALSGPIEVAIEAFLDGYVPRHVKDIVKPGYPRGNRTAE